MSSVQQNVIKHKVGLLNLAAELGNVSRACKVMVFSRDTFYRYQAAMEAGGIEALLDANRRKRPTSRPHRRSYGCSSHSLEQPAFGQVRVSNELRKRGIFVSPSGVRSVWPHQNLESFKKRLSALEKHVAETGAVLTEHRCRHWRRNRTMMLPMARSKPPILGISVVRIPFTSAPSRVLGRIYQQTFVDTYSKWAVAKLCTTKTPITAADLLNGRGLSFFAGKAWGSPAA